MHLVQNLTGQLCLAPLGHGQSSQLDLAIRKVGPAHDLQPGMLASVVIDRVIGQILVEKETGHLGLGGQVRQMSCQLPAAQRCTEHRIDFQLGQVLEQ